MKTIGVANQAPQTCCEQTDRRMDWRNGPSTRPAFAKAMQVKNKSFLINIEELFLSNTYNI